MVSTLQQKKCRPLVDFTGDPIILTQFVVSYTVNFVILRI